MTTSFSDLRLPARDLFDLPGDVAWLNSAYLGARAKPVAEAVAASVNRPLSEVSVSDFFGSRGSDQGVGLLVGGGRSRGSGAGSLRQLRRGHCGGGP